jgi:hypothetical protein
MEYITSVFPAGQQHIGFGNCQAVWHICHFGQKEDRMMESVRISESLYPDTKI